MKFPAVEIDKRDRDEHTDTLIKSLLNEEKASKKQKRGPSHADVGTKTAVPQAGKGKTFAEIEEEEGGPIKESLVGMAHTKRALDRKKRDVEFGDTDMVTNTERYEKDTLDVEQEDGITFEPFNLKQEREEGYFDEDGNYVLRKQGGEEGEDEKDAWLTSAEAKVVSDDVRRKIEQQRAAADEAARRGPLTERQIAQRKADMAAIMRTGETVTRALKRLGGGGGAGAAVAGGLPHRAMGKRERARLLAQQQQQQAADAAAAPTAGGDTEAREQFTRLAELADELLGEGELEIYSATQEELVRSARMWLPQLAAAAPAAPLPPPGGPAPAAVAAAGGDDDDDDMFADKDEGSGGAAAKVPPAAAAVDQDQDMFADDDDEGDGPGTKASSKQGEAATAADTSGRAGAGEGAQSGGGAAALSAPGAAPSGLGPAAAAAAATAAEGAAAGGGNGGGGGAVDYGSWPVKELKRLLQERGVDPGGFVEKADLVSKLREVVDAAPGAAAAHSTGPGNGGGEGAFVAPPGYVFDPSSGYFYSEDAGMYYDTSSGGYCQAATGKWFYLDPSSGSFAEWKQAGQ